MSFAIKEYQPSDLPTVLDLHRKALEPVGAYIDDPSFHYDLQNIEDHYTNNKGVFLIGTLDNSIVAMVAFRKSSLEVAEIKRMRTYP